MGEEKGAIVITGHGSRLPYNSEVLEFIRSSLKKDDSFKNFEIEVGFVQINSPKLSDILESFIKKGYRKIIVTSVFISRGIHTDKDIRGIVDEITDRYSNVEILITDPIGKDKRLVDIIRDRIYEELKSDS